jgi:hypothetical protein
MEKIFDKIILASCTLRLRTSVLLRIKKKELIINKINHHSSVTEISRTIYGW